MHNNDDIVAAGDARASPDVVLSRLDTLPTLAPVAVRLLQATSDDETGLREVSALIERDQSLTAHVLKAANAASRGGGGKISSVQRAVAMIGFGAVRSLVLTVRVFDCFRAAPEEVRMGGFDRNELWKHSLAVACAARRIARLAMRTPIAPDDAYVAGLLHDIGKVALVAVFPKAYERIARQSDHARGEIADFERDVLGVDHTVVGRRLAERWKLPKALQDVVWLHHLSAEALPASVSAPGLIEVVRLADTVAREQRIGYSGNHVFYESTAEAARRLDIDAERLAQAVEPLVSEVAEHAALMGIDEETSDAMYLKALRDANAEMGRLHGELTAKNQRLVAGARYFRAVCQFNLGWDGSSELRDVVAAGAKAAMGALQRDAAGAFALRDDGRVLEFCWHTAAADQAVGQPCPTPADLTDWLGNPSALLAAQVAEAPPPVRALLTAVEPRPGPGRPWLLPIIRENVVLGGVLFLSDSDEIARLAGEASELSSFVAYLALAIDTTNAHAAARRLSEDLADTNRRLQHTQMQLLRSRTLSMVAEMASGAAHELNSPLTVISGRAQMLHTMTDDSEMQRSLDLIRSKAHECSRIVSELMDFARPRTPNLGHVELGPLLEELRAECIAESELPASNIVLNISPQAPTALADRAQIRSVLTELIDNAREALLDRSGIIEINCREQISADVVEVSVRDTGSGMTPTVLERAFDPFFSYRKAGRRRGFGLAQAHRIVEAHGGKIWLESRPDEGTTAYVVIPAAVGEPTPRSADAGRSGSVQPEPVDR